MGYSRRWYAAVDLGGYRMAQLTLIQPTDAAVFDVVHLPTRNHPNVTVTADGLLAGETVTVLLFVANGNFVPLKDPSGVPVVLTSAIPMWTLVGGPEYGVVKSATAALVGVYADEGSRSY